MQLVILLIEWFLIWTGKKLNIYVLISFICLIY